MHKVLSIFLVVWLMAIGIINNTSAGDERSPKIAKKDATVDMQSQALKPQTTDMHTGKPINKNVYEDYNGKRIYFCCVLHKKPFHKDPDAYFKKFQEQGIALEDVPATSTQIIETVQTLDMMTGEPINRNIYADYNGKRIYFCCESHKKTFDMNPEMYIKQFPHKGVVFEDIPAKK